MHKFDFSDFKTVSDKMETAFEPFTSLTEETVGKKYKVDGEVETFRTPYIDLKDCYAVQESIMICSYLSDYKNYLDKKDTSDIFITRMSVGTRILPFTNLDLSILWSNRDMDLQLKKYVLFFLHLLYTLTLEIYNLCTSPDIDIKKFSEILISAINKVSNQPELSRCKKAFNKIKNSVGLLENNFNGYYKDFIQSKNPTTLIESFVLDVANNESADPETTREFRKIISYYAKVSSQQKIKDPKVKKLFDILNSKMTMLEKSQNIHHNPKQDAQDTEVQITEDVQDTEVQITEDVQDTEDADDIQDMPDLLNAIHI
jgi:hypothetical protein